MATVRAIIKKGNKFFLIKRLSNDVGGGLYQFVGGNIDGNETPTQALLREVEEEIGCQVVKYKEIKEIHNSIMGSNTIFYLVKIKGRIKIQHSEISSYGYFTRQQLKKLPLTFGTKNFFNLK